MTPPSASSSRGCARTSSPTTRPSPPRSDGCSTPWPSRPSAGTLPAGLSEFAANPRAADYARFRAEVERRGAWWGAWPRTEREGSLAGSALDDDRARYHLFAQWVAAEQLSEAAGRASAAGGLILDLPIGVHGAGYDVWRERDSFAPDVAAGAPPDAFWSQGQDWGAPPPHPHGAREAGYRYHDEVLPHAVPLRRGRPHRPRDRAAPALLGAARRLGPGRRLRPLPGGGVVRRCSRSPRNEAGAVVVGEDLGTVPGLRPTAMEAHGLLRTYVAQREAGQRRSPRAARPSPSPA